MRIRIHMTSGDAVDCEQFSVDNGATWKDITVDAVVAVMGLESGYTVVNDVLTNQWRVFRNARIESIGPAGDLSEIINAEVERRIQVLLSEQLPTRVVTATQKPDPEPAPDPEPDTPVTPEVGS